MSAASTVILLASVVAAATTAAATLDGYTKIAGTDAPGHDLARVPGGNATSPADLAARCDATPGCLGFNSNGYLKYAVSDQRHPRPSDLYVKRTPAFPPGRIPPPAWAWGGWDRFPALWFGANATPPGFENAAQAAGDARYPVAIFGHQAGHGECAVHGGCGCRSNTQWHEERTLAKNAAIVKAAAGEGRAPPRVFVYRHPVVTQSWYGLVDAVQCNGPASRPADDGPCALNPAYEGFWLRCPEQDGGAGAVLEHSQHYCGQLWYDFRNASAADYFINTIMAEVAAEPDVDGVFFDTFDRFLTDNRACDTAQHCAALTPAVYSELFAATVAVLRRSAALLRAHGKLAMVSVGVLQLDNKTLPGDAVPMVAPPAAGTELARTSTDVGAGGGVGSNAACGPQPHFAEELLLEAVGPAGMLRFYEFFPHTGHACVSLLLNARAEAAKGLPIAVTAHLHDFTFSLAAFLVVMGEYSYFGYSNNTRWLDNDWAWHPEYDRVYGAPAGLASYDGAFGFAREFAHASVHVDCMAEKGTITMK